MAFELTAEETRVLGALLEKKHTTPDYYPLTLNGLVTACNQKSNREPVMNLDDQTTLSAIDGLRQLEFAWMVQSVDARVPKYEENMEKKLGLTLQETAALTVLFLRGPQTPGEIRGRTSRIYPFDSMDEVNITLDTLMDKEDPLVVKLPLQPGRKEARYMHLFNGAPDLEAPAEASAAIVVPTSVGSDSGKVRELEERVTALEARLVSMQEAFDTFKAQFE